MISISLQGTTGRIFRSKDNTLVIVPIVLIKEGRQGIHNSQTIHALIKADDIGENLYASLLKKSKNNGSGVAVLAASDNIQIYRRNDGTSNLMMLNPTITIA